jgi:predicted metal-dependent phosphoesterase TrpH
MTPLGRADLHIHTTASDGRYTVQEILQHLQTRRPRLDVIAITDHDVLDASLWAYEHQTRYQIEVVPGVEVSSLGGHVLALWVTTPIPMNMPLAETVQAIHEAGGLAILAHPFHLEFDVVRANAFRYLTQPQVLLEAGLDGIEVHNAGIVTPACNWVARWVAHQLGITAVGCSDAHTLNAIGTGMTRWLGSSAESLRAAIISKTTNAEGTAWNISDYIEYLQTELFTREKPSLASMTSSATVPTAPQSNVWPY